MSVGNRLEGHKCGVMAWLVCGLACLFGALPNGYAGSPVGSGMPGSERNNRAGEEPVTFVMRGSLILVEGGVYGIRDSENVETTVIGKSGTMISGNPKIGDQVEVEYLENGTALSIRVVTTNPPSGQMPMKK